MSILSRRRPRNEAPVPYVPRSYARSGLSWFGNAKAGGPSAEQLGALTASGTLFGVVDSLTTAVAGAEWALYRKPPDGSVDTDDEREQVSRHAALSLWERPNPFMTGAYLRETVQQFAELTGEGPILLVKAGTLPVEMWPVRPDRLRPVPHPTEFLTGWIYLSPDGEKIPFRPDEVLTGIRRPNPLDPYRGLGAVSAIGVEVDAAQFAAEWNRNFFLNSAEPGGVIEVETRLSDAQFDELVTRWNEQHGGVQRAHRVAVIEQGKWVGRGFSQREMDFGGLRAGSRDAIMEAFRVSRAKLGMTDGVNFAAAKAANYQHYHDLIEPRLVRWRELANQALLPMFGTPGGGVEFDFATPAVEDVEAEAQDRTSRVGAAVAILGLPGVSVDPNEVFAAYGLPELTSVAMTSVPDPVVSESDSGQVLPPAVDSRQGHLAISPISEVACGAPEAGGFASPVPPARIRPMAVTEDGDEIPDLSEIAQAWERAVDRLLDQWSGVSAAQRSRLRRQIREAVDSEDLARLSELDVDSAEGAALLAEALDRLARDVATLTASEYPAVELTAATPDSDLNGAVATAVAALLAMGLAAAAGREALRLWRPGVSGEEIAAGVDGFLRSLSDATLRSSLGGALTGAQNRARVDTISSGPVGSIYATEQLDRNTCGPCRRIDGRFVCTTEDLAPYELLYTAFGGYVGCEGGMRCRGSVTGVWRPMTTGEA